MDTYLQILWIVRYHLAFAGIAFWVGYAYVKS